MNKLLSILSFYWGWEFLENKYLIMLILTISLAFIIAFIGLSIASSGSVSHPEINASSEMDSNNETSSSISSTSSDDSSTSEPDDEEDTDLYDYDTYDDSSDYDTYEEDYDYTYEDEY